MNNIKIYLAISLFCTLIFLACTPSSDNSVTPGGDEEPTTYIRLWSQQNDTIYLMRSDSLKTFDFYADVKEENLVIPDSTQVRFYANFGQIGELEYTTSGQAKSKYQPIDEEKNILYGDLTVIANVTLGEILYDTLKMSILKNLGNEEIIVTKITPPAKDTLVIYEADSLSFRVHAFSLNHEELHYSWELDGEILEADSDSLKYVTDYESEGIHRLKLRIYTAEGSNLNFSWIINVLHSDAPLIVDSIEPNEGGTITIDEGNTINFEINCHDPDNHPIFYSWRKNELEVSQTNSYQFVADFDSHGEYELSLDVNPNLENALSYQWKIIVNDQDGTIIVNEILPNDGGNIIMYEGESQNFSIDAYDPDGNSLFYSWNLNDAEVATGNSFIFMPDFESSGEYLLKLAVSDGEGEKSLLEYNWNITVLDQDIAVQNIFPATNEIVHLKEGEAQQFVVVANNTSGGTLSFKWFFDGNQIAQEASIYNYLASYEDSGNHELKCTIISNQRATVDIIWQLEVEDVDRPIVVNSITPSEGNGEYHTISVNTPLTFTIDCYDPDGNQIFYSWKVDEAEVSFTNSFILFKEEPGTYNVTLNITDLYGKDSRTFSWFVIVQE